MSETMSNEAGPESLQSLSDEDLRNLRRAMREEMKRRGLVSEKKAGGAGRKAGGAGRKAGAAGRKGAKGKAKGAGRRGAKGAKGAGAGGGEEA